MTLDIHERDISPDLCRICGSCCRVTFRLRDTTPRYRRFLRQIGYALLPPPAAGNPDCCEKKHDATVDLGFCRNLEVTERPDGPVYRCRVYGGPDFPELCEQFNCVSWAKANETYSTRNGLLANAQRALNRLRASREGAPSD